MPEVKGWTLDYEDGKFWLTNPLGERSTATVEVIESLGYTVHRHTPQKYQQCKKNQFWDDLRNLLGEFSFSATIPRQRLVDLVKEHGLDAPE